MATSLRLPGKLWPHQKAAIRTIYGYLTEEGHDDGASCLITMPTGTGKSGVIAWSVTRLPNLKGHRLVITPWVALTRQLTDDIETRFWNSLAKDDKPKHMPEVRRLPRSSEIDTLAEIEAPTVFVATTAAISTLANECRRKGEDIAEKFQGFDLVLVDEGHYEPSEKWSEAIRALNLPTVLLTATPYRNDLKYFEIGEHRYRFPHHDAQDERFLRKPEFEVIPTADPAAFAAQLKSLVEKEFGGDESVRVIVRCKDWPTIQRMVIALQALGEGAIGIHEHFRPGDSSFKPVVPKRDEEGQARYWVHQYKLVEGIDDPRFKAVALFDSLRNGRAIVQQIGRVLRNPARDEDDMKALVVGRGDRDLEQVWSGYMVFDQQAVAESVATMSDLVETLLNSQPPAFYFDGNYRVRIDLTSPTAWRMFAFPLRTRVFRSIEDDGVSIEQLADLTADAWEGLDRSVFVTQRPDDRTAIVPYITAENSPLLRSGTFVEPEFGYTSLRLSDDLLFVYDARGRIPPVVLDSFAPLAASELTRLFPSGSSGLTSVSLHNTDIGKQAARSRQVRAAAIDSLAPDLADYGYVCTIAEGYIGDADKRARRYVGLSRARLTDYRTTEGDFAAYSEWLDEVEQDVRSNQPAVGTFARYATYAPIPADPSPVHVLLDIDPRDFVKQEDGKAVQLDLEDTAYEVKDGAFAIPLAESSYDATLTWNGKGYELTCLLQLQNYVENVPDGRELIHTINEDQLLRVVPTDQGVIYSHGQFVAPRALKAAAGIISLLTPIDALGSASTEKGKTSTGNDWDAKSVFGMISALAPSSAHHPEKALADLLAPPDLLLCTDLGTEIADFMAIKNNRVVLIHAKASKSPAPASASALHDVVSQALKNLPYLQPFEEVAPPMGRWGKPWKADDGGTIQRNRAGDFKSSAEAWKQIRAVIADPQADREVWLVLGQALSIAKLKTEMAKTKKPPAPEVLQIFSLLQTAWAATSQMGARLRVFCSP